MAKKKKGEDGEKKQKKGGGGKACLIPCIAVLLIIVLIAGFFIAIIEGILGIILEFIKALLEFFKDPIGFLKECFRVIGNWFASWLGGDYDPPDPAQAYMAVYVDDATVEQIKEGLADIKVDDGEAGLTDSVLKSMIIAYYSTYATVDTLIYTPINKDEREELEKNGRKIDPDTYSDVEDVMDDINGNSLFFKGKGSDFKGENGQLYLGTKGTVQPRTSSGGKKLQYYDNETFFSIAAEFEEAIEDDDDEDYIDSFFKTFRSIYTIAPDATGSITLIKADTGVLPGGGHTQGCSIDYREKIAKYAMPIELMVNLLDITASPDFVNAVTELLEGSSIVFRVHEASTSTITKTSLEYTLVDETNSSLSDENKPTYYANLNSLKLKPYPSYTTDFVLTLDSVNCWYCTAKYDVETEYKNFVNGPWDETSSFDYEKFLRMPVSFGNSDAWDVSIVDHTDDSGVSFLNGFNTEDNRDIRESLTNPIGYALYRITGYNVPAHSIRDKKATSWKEGRITVYKESTGTHTDNTDVFVNLLKTKYFDLYIREKETATPGDLLVNGAEAFFQLLEESTNTAPYVNVMRYILYRYSGIDYGVTNFEDLVNVFDYNPFSVSSSAGLVEYIFNYITGFEGTTGIDGDCYIAIDGGDGMITIGHGMTNAVPGLEHIVAGSRVPIETVDGLQKDIIKDNLDWAKREFPNMTNYQLVGFVSFMYNGPGSSVELFDAYRRYWNEERDNKYFDEITTADIPNLDEQLSLIQSRSGGVDDAACAHNEEILTQLKAYVDTPLYSNFWGGYCHGTYYGKRIIYGGLLARKWAEFMMFQYGYNWQDGTFCSVTGSLDNWDGDVYVSRDYTFPVYSQFDPRWGNVQYGAYSDKNIHSSGCGCCSMSVILSGYTGTAITPDMLTETLNRLYPSKNYYVYGKGSNGLVWSNTTAGEYGCSISYCNTTQALEALRNGYAVCGHEDGHVLAFVPVSAEDAAQGYVFRIIDSARGHQYLCRDFNDAERQIIASGSSGGTGVKVIVYPPGH